MKNACFLALTLCLMITGIPQKARSETIPMERAFPLTFPQRSYKSAAENCISVPVFINKTPLLETYIFFDREGNVLAADPAPLSSWIAENMAPEYRERFHSFVAAGKIPIGA